MKVQNNTDLTESQITSRRVIGVIRNNWRNRLVTLYESDDSKKAYMIGVSFNQDLKVISHEEIGLNERIAIDYWQHGNKLFVRD